ncbi:hypothetical protein DSLASN_38410 [Desulfoluna limicola]|uniref:Uncharacterized protein n=1 Tax=Desulfoluna limicola TaxID=2810562 RepID=A0ABN6F796_9BACT|nr:hypothetical protein DSLASN_38410 [Desulfoluna limicola]
MPAGTRGPPLWNNWQKAGITSVGETDLPHSVVTLVLGALKGGAGKAGGAWGGPQTQGQNIKRRDEDETVCGHRHRKLRVVPGLSLV